jgi:RES domain-containing protein
MASTPEPKTVYRIARVPYADLSGEGARLAGGRWNRPGKPAVYSAQSRALAILEALVHFQPYRLPTDLVLLSIEIPGGVPQATWAESELPDGWNEIGAEAALDRGDQWLEAATTTVLWVPSVIVRQELNAVLNPRHPDHAKIRITAQPAFAFDHRLVNRPPSK